MQNQKQQCLNCDSHVARFSGREPEEAVAQVLQGLWMRTNQYCQTNYAEMKMSETPHKAQSKMSPQTLRSKKQER